jgi:hypothetical protein
VVETPRCSNKPRIPPMMLRTLGLVLALMLPCEYAQSEPIALACSGKMTAARRHVTEDYSISITVDIAARTVTVGSYGTVPILGDLHADTVTFMKNKDTLAEASTGTLNRLTGVASVHIITLIDGLYQFYGTCKPAQRLF